MPAFLKTLVTRISNSLNRASSTDEGYLAQSSDVCDLERRIRFLERRGNGFIV